MANERHTDQREWDIDFSTRQSIHAVTKYSPFREATSTTASTLFTPAQGEIAVNWVTNPRVESTTISMYTATGSAISRDTGQQAVGAASLLVNPTNSDAGEGFYWDSPTIPFSVHPQYLSVQVEVRGASASGSVKLDLRDATGATIHATSGSHDLTTGFVQLTASYGVPGSTDPATYRLYVVSAAQHNINWYNDKIMFEVREDTTAVSTYVDGASGIGYAWTGTANESTSIKKRGMTTIKGMKIVNESSTGAEIVYVAIGTTATSSTGIPVGAGETFEPNIQLGFTDYISVLSGSGTPTIRGVIWGV
jgi:hypothetical protein|tara:strand:+ start:289 stop:1209 length:921 start_codon:yes stop_codon:yes gene_type:complete